MPPVPHVHGRGDVHVDVRMHMRAHMRVHVLVYSRMPTKIFHPIMWAMQRRGVHATYVQSVMSWLHEDHPSNHMDGAGERACDLSS